MGPQSRWAERLAWTAGADTIAITSQKLDSPNPRTFIGSGKADEIGYMAHEMHADIVIFDDGLPRRNKQILKN